MKLKITYGSFLRPLDVLFAVHVHGPAGGLVEDVGQCAPVDHDGLMRAVVCGQEDAFPGFVVRCDIALDVAEPRGWERGQWPGRGQIIVGTHCISLETRETI